MNKLKLVRSMMHVLVPMPVPAPLVRHIGVNCRFFGSMKHKMRPIINTPPTKKQEQEEQQSDLIKSLSNTNGLSLIESAFRIIGGVPFFPIGFYTVNKNHVGVIEYFGKYYDTKPEGLQFNLPFMMNCTPVFVGLRSLNMSKSKVLDKDGNPIILAAILNYHVKDPVKFTYNVNEPLTFLENQASSCVKDIASKYRYDELKSESKTITLEVIANIQKLVQETGIEICGLNLSDLSYAPEIAQQMLVKQQAVAHIEARKMIVDSSVAIVNEILEKLDMDKESKNKAAINLLTVLVSNSGAHNVVNLN